MYESLSLKLPSPVTQLHDKILEQKNIQLFVKRDDLIHPHLQGNKWRKLKYNLLHARSQNLNSLLTFGGAYSNHIHATAAAGHLLGFNTIGVIRGEQTLPLNPTLQDAADWGMHLDYVSRTEYRQKTSSEFINKLKQKYGKFYLIPEGGSNLLALQGCAELVTEIEKEFDVVCTACGTGATMAGIIQGLDNKARAIGFSILKANDYIEKEVTDYLKQNKIFRDNWLINTDYDFGGYAKFNPELIAFMKSFYKKHDIQLEPVYTAKMFYGLFDLIENNYFQPGTSILAIHTGGIQGLRGFNLQKNNNNQSQR